MSKTKYHFNTHSLKYEKVPEKVLFFRRILWYSVIIAALSISLYSSIYYFLELRPNSKKLSADDLKLKISELENISNELGQIKEFIEDQKQRTILQEKKYDQLRQENDKLSLVRNANKEVLDAYQYFIEKREIKAKWLDRIISFFSGILASIIASYIIIPFTKKSFPPLGEVSREGF